jgi:hypothetical protein
MIYFLPSFYAALPFSLRSVLPHAHIPWVMVAAAAAAAAVAVLHLAMRRPYRTQKEVRWIGFLFVESVPVSLIWCIEELRPPGVLAWLAVCALIAVPIWFCAGCLPVGRAVADDNDSAEPIATEPVRWPRSILPCERTDLFVTAYFALSLVVMTYCNAHAARRMPLGPALPDVAHDIFPVGDELRRSRQFGAFQFSNIACLLNGVSMIIALIIRPEHVNARKPAVIYATVAYIRAVAFTVTGLPAACAGLAKCPCADPATVKAFREKSPLAIAMGWLIGAGIYLPHPQCGDLIISGHTMWLWLSWKMMKDVINRLFKEPFDRLLRYLTLALVMPSMIYIIIVRNHYSVDVFFGWLLIEVLWIAYSVAEVAARKPRKGTDMWLVKLVRWIETRQTPLAARRASDAMQLPTNC